MRVAVLIAAGGLAASPTAAVGQVEPGRIYEGGETISDPSIGLTLTLPRGWRGRLGPGGESFLMESLGGDAYMVVIGDEVSEAEARTMLAQPVDVGGGVVLRPAGDVRDVGAGHLSSDFSVTGAATELTGTVDVRLTSTGLGVAFVLLAPPAAADTHRASMREFALSLGVTEPAAAPAGGQDEWEPYLQGRYLAHFYTDTGYTESRELWLCSDGTFWYDSQGGGFGGGASGAMQSRGGGRWSATGAGASGTLVLDWSNGGRNTWSLEYDYDADRLYVNGERMLRGANERCG
jgi:hypothetical protein